MSEDDGLKAMGQVIQIDEARIRDHLGEMVRGTVEEVEPRCGAVTLGRTYLLPPLSSGGASMVPPWLRFHIPLIGRVEGWRAGVARGSRPAPRLQPPPRRTQRADFPHCAPPFASRQSLWDL